MPIKISHRLAAIVDALPICEGQRVLEIGCGPGVVARAIIDRFHTIQVVAIDRSAKAIAQAIATSTAERATGRLEFRCSSIEDFERINDEPLFDIAFAIRVGALDGRHPIAGKIARQRLRNALTPTAPLLIDGGTPLRTINLQDGSIS